MRNAHSKNFPSSLLLTSLALGPPLPKLASRISALNGYLGGGFPFGSLVEWGMPMGRGGRELLRSFLSNRQEKHFVLWILNSKAEMSVYPPAWVAQGVDLSLLRFVACERPVEQLKAVFLNPVFKIIVLDMPLFISKEELAFIAGQARKNAQLILLLRPYFLTSERGNVWAKLRLNAWQDPLRPDWFTVKRIRGHLKPEVVFEKSFS